MTHDPLCPINSGPCCPWMGHCDCQCECDWIARVREDERKRFDDDGAEWDIRAAVIRDVVAAIYRTCGHTKYAGCSPCAHDDAVAAIEALGGEQ